MGEVILHRSDFLKSGQLVTGQTCLIYKGNDGTARSINPSNYAAANHNHNGVYQPAGSYAAANHNHSGVYQPVGSYATTAQLNEVKTSVSNGKSLIASAITDKGVSTASSATFQTMASNIGKIPAFGNQNLNSVNGILINTDSSITLYAVCTELRPFLYKPGYNDIPTTNTILFLNVIANGYTKVLVTSDSYSYKTYLRIYSYDGSSATSLKYISGDKTTTSYQNLDFTMTSSTIYFISVKYEVGPITTIQFA